MTENDKLEVYLVFIKKVATSEVWNSELHDDVVQEVFIKLYNNDFFQKNDLEDGAVSKQASSYIYQTVRNKRTDIHRSRNPKDSITDSIDIDFDRRSDDLGVIESHEIFEEAKNAYSTIKNCFETISKSVKGQEKLTFFYTAFWELSDLEMTIKELAKHLGFMNSNPTQEFNRFVTKVSSCTERNGVKLTKPNEQVEILMDLMGAAG